MIHKTRNLLANINKRKKERFHGKFLVLFILLYFAILGVYMISHNMWFSMDQFIIVGFVLALVIAEPFLFLRDWIPFALLFLGFEFLRGLAPILGLRVHITSMINADKIMFGSLPTVNLQNYLYIPGNLRFYDYIFSVLYMMHFALPFIFGFVLWVKKRHEYWKFAVTLIVLSYLAFLTYVLYPAMPPWMASEKGFIPQVYDVFGATFGAIVKGSALPSVYNMMNPNPIAAMPSLHAAYPFLVYIFFIKIYGKVAHVFSLYVLAVCFGIVYLGQHYVIDVIFGLAYAYGAFKLVDFLWNKGYFRKLILRKELAVET